MSPGLAPPRASADLVRASIADNTRRAYETAFQLRSNGGATVPGRQIASSAGHASDGQEHPENYHAAGQGRRSGGTG